MGEVNYTARKIEDNRDSVHEHLRKNGDHLDRPTQKTKAAKFADREEAISAAEQSSRERKHIYALEKTYPRH